MPGAFFLEYFTPQLDFSEKKKGLSDAFYLFMSVLIFTFLLVGIVHMTLISPGDFQSILLNPLFTASMIILVAIGDRYFRKICSRYMASAGETISFVSDRHKISMDISELMYVESNDREVHIHSADGRTFRNKTPISQWEGALGDRFIRTHRAFLVNKSYISAWNPGNISVGGKTIPVSRKYKAGVCRYVMSSGIPDSQ